MRRELGLVVVAVLAAGCVVPIGGEAVPEAGGTSRVANSTAPLPFTPAHAGRTNERNDGTKFEPCTAYTDDEMQSLGAEPRSIKDAAISDAPNYRGCHWQSPDGALRFSQIVGNEESLAAYKEKQSRRSWQPDRTINGRTVILTTERDEGCYASFMSEGAAVHSSYRVTYPRKPTADLVAECNKAIEWATLAISKAP